MQKIYCRPFIFSAGETYVWLGGIATFLFLLLAASILVNDFWRGIDASVYAVLLDLRQSWLNAVLLFITQINSMLALNLYAAVWAAYLFSRRCNAEAGLVIWTVCGGSLLNTLIKHLIARPRPELPDALLHLTTYSFPSGHSSAVMLFYGLLLSSLWSGPISSLASHRLVTSFACVLIALTGLSRVYLGAHFFSDVLGGLLFGTAYLCWSLYGYTRLQRSRGWASA